MGCFLTPPGSSETPCSIQAFFMHRCMPNSFSNSSMLYFTSMLQCKLGHIRCQLLSSASYMCMRSYCMCCLMLCAKFKSRAVRGSSFGTGLVSVRDHATLSDGISTFYGVIVETVYYLHSQRTFRVKHVSDTHYTCLSSKCTGLHLHFTACKCKTVCINQAVTVCSSKF